MKQSKGSIVLFVALAFVLAACGRESGGGAGSAEGEPIPVGAIFDLSGPTSDVGTPYSEGLRDYVDWRNENGGVGGRPLKLVWQDYKYEVPVAEQLYSQFVAQDVVAFMGWGTGDTEALRAKIATDKIPFMSASYAETLTDPETTPFNFVIATSYSDQMRIALKWIAEQEAGPTEVAVFHHDSPFGQSPIADGEAYVRDQRLDIGYKAYTMPTGATDFVGELSRARSQGAKYVIVQNVSSPAATLAKNIAQEELAVKIVCLNWCADELLVKLAGPAAEGAYGVLPWSPPSDASGVEEPRKYLEEKGGSLEEKGLHYLQGWYHMAAMAEAIDGVVVAGGEITGESVKAELERLTFDTGGVSSEIKFSNTSHKGMKGARLFQVKSGKLTAVTDEIEP